MGNRATYKRRKYRCFNRKRSRWEVLLFQKKGHSPLLKSWQHSTAQSQRWKATGAELVLLSPSNTWEYFFYSLWEKKKILMQMRDSDKQLLRQGYSNFNVHMDLLEILFKCRLWFGRSEAWDCMCHGSPCFPLWAQSLAHSRAFCSHNHATVSPEPLQQINCLIFLKRQIKCALYSEIMKIFATHWPLLMKRHCHNKLQLRLKVSAESLLVDMC